MYSRGALATDQAQPCLASWATGLGLQGDMAVAHSVGGNALQVMRVT